MEPEQELARERARGITRRTFFGQTGLGLGAIALDALTEEGAGAQQKQRATPVAHATAGPLAPKRPDHKVKAKSIIYLHMSGAPPTLDMFDYKPELIAMNMKDCPESLRKGERFAFIQGVPKMLGTPYKFAQHGQGGAWVGETLPHMATIMDEVTLIRSMHTDQFNHAPAELFLYTGNAIAGDASLGAWATYGLGSENQDLPGFVVLVSGGTDPTGGKSLWGSGFLPSVYQGVQCRSAGEPILYLSDPVGMSRANRRDSLDALAKLNQAEAQRLGDPETITRIAQYELAYRMQMAVPQVMDIAKEPKSTLDMYGAQPGQPTFANNCLLARRLVEQGVRFVQLYDWGWDIHGTGPGDDLMTAFPRKCKETDQAAAALIKDLKQRGLLDQTIVVWGGEFGRTPMNEARGGSKYLGRDHHPHNFCLWMAGGGIKAGQVYGETDEFGYKIVKDPVGIRDLQATLLYALGLDPYRLSYKYQGLDHRLIGPTDEGIVRKGLLA